MTLFGGMIYAAGICSCSSDQSFLCQMTQGFSMFIQKASWFQWFKTFRNLLLMHLKCVGHNSDVFKCKRILNVLETILARKIGAIMGIDVPTCHFQTRFVQTNACTANDICTVPINIDCKQIVCSNDNSPCKNSCDKLSGCIRIDRCDLYGR